MLSRLQVYILWRSWSCQTQVREHTTHAKCFSFFCFQRQRLKNFHLKKKKRKSLKSWTDATINSELNKTAQWGSGIFIYKLVNLKFLEFHNNAPAFKFKLALNPVLFHLCTFSLRVKKQFAIRIVSSGNFWIDN